MKTELSTDDIMNKIEQEKEEAARKTREEFKVNKEAPCIVTRNTIMIDC